MVTRVLNSEPKLLGVQKSGSRSSPVFTSHYYTFPLQESLTISEGHPSIRGKYHDGGPFEVRRAGYEVIPSKKTSWVATNTSTTQRAYDGMFVPRYFGNLSSTQPVMSLPNDILDLDAMGPKGFARYQPVNAALDLGEYIGELRNFKEFAIGVKRRGEALRDGRADKLHSQSFLDEAFGLGVLARDMKKLYNLQQLLAKQLNQLRRDNGKPVRRKGRVDVVETKSVTSSSTSNGSYTNPLFTTQHYVGTYNAFRQVTSTVSTVYSFAGRFKYWIPNIPQGISLRDPLTRRLLGLDVENFTSLSKLIWNLAPWSWMIDWAVDVDSLLSNINSAAVDNLVADYAYIMGHRKRETHVYATVWPQGTSLQECYITRIEEVKSRRAVNPYGYGLNTNWLTPRRALILANIGVTKYL